MTSSNTTQNNTPATGDLKELGSILKDTFLIVPGLKKIFNQLYPEKEREADKINDVNKYKGKYIVLAAILFLVAIIPFVNFIIIMSFLMYYADKEKNGETRTASRDSSTKGKESCREEGKSKDDRELEEGEQELEKEEQELKKQEQDLEEEEQEELEKEEEQGKEKRKKNEGKKTDTPPGSAPRRDKATESARNRRKNNNYEDPGIRVSASGDQSPPTTDKPRKPEAARLQADYDKKDEVPIADYRKLDIMTRPGNPLNPSSSGVGAYFLVTIDDTRRHMPQSILSLTLKTVLLYKSQDETLINVKRLKSDLSMLSEKHKLAREILQRNLIPALALCEHYSGASGQLRYYSDYDECDPDHHCYICGISARAVNESLCKQKSDESAGDYTMRLQECYQARIKQERENCAKLEALESELIQIKEEQDKKTKEHTPESNLEDPNPSQTGDPEKNRVPTAATTGS